MFSSGEPRPYSVSEFINHCNLNLSRDFSNIEVEGEVASFKINQGKWVFFDLKEGEHSVNCFMVRAKLTAALEDGMKIRVSATPRLTNWGRFSLTVTRVLPVGEGDIKKNFELLKKRLTVEGLFDPAKKRPLPAQPSHIGVISSTSAAGYIDFLKILDNRWGGLEIKTINTQVQGLAAPEQIIRALEYFNQHGGVEVVAILRGGGSADDLSAFNDEALVRAIAASKIPVLTGIGHEIDESLADLASDVRASTPSNAAERLSSDRTAVIRQAYLRAAEAGRLLLSRLDDASNHLRDQLRRAETEIAHSLDNTLRHIRESARHLESLNPESVLRRGYAILASQRSPGEPLAVGDKIRLTTINQIISAEVTNAQER